MDQPEEVQNQIPKITDELQPKTEEENLKRLVHFALQMRYLARELMSDFWLAAKAGEYGEGVQKAILQGVSNNLYSNAVKEVCCISIYLAMLDQDNPEGFPWLLDFLHGAQLMIDKFIVGTSAKEIMQVHEYSQGYNIERDSAGYLCLMLGFKETPELAIQALTALYDDSKNTRKDLLLTSLTEGMANINEYLTEIK